MLWRRRSLFVVTSGSSWLVVAGSQLNNIVVISLICVYIIPKLRMENANKYNILFKTRNCIDNYEPIWRSTLYTIGNYNLYTTNEWLTDIYLTWVIDQLKELPRQNWLMFKQKGPQNLPTHCPDLVAWKSSSQRYRGQEPCHAADHTTARDGFTERSQRQGEKKSKRSHWRKTTEKSKIWAGVYIL